MSPIDRFPIPYLATFSIASSWTDEIKISLPLFRDLQTTPKIPQIYKPTTGLPHHALFPFTLTLEICVSDLQTQDPEGKSSKEHTHTARLRLRLDSLSESSNSGCPNERRGHLFIQNLASSR
jgi:hypothetical protein